jgi:hypothetical protein
VPSRPAADVENALIAKGMERTQSHHVMLRKTVDGVTHLVTRVSQGRGGEIGDGLAKMMANQCCLQLAEFWRLIECTLTEDEWDALVTQRCSDGRNPFLR